MAYTGQKEGSGWLGYGIYWSEGRERLVRIWHILVRRKESVGQKGYGRCWSEGMDVLGVGQKLEGRW